MIRCVMAVHWPVLDNCENYIRNILYLPEKNIYIIESEESKGNDSTNDL